MKKKKFVSIDILNENEKIVKTLNSLILYYYYNNDCFYYYYYHHHSLEMPRTVTRVRCPCHIFFPQDLMTSSDFSAIGAFLIHQQSFCMKHAHAYIPTHIHAHSLTQTHLHSLTYIHTRIPLHLHPHTNLHPQPHLSTISTPTRTISNDNVNFIT